MLCLGIGANLACGSGYGLLGVLIWAWPPVVFIGAVEIAMQLVRRSHGPRAATTVPDVPPVPGMAAGRRHPVPRRRMRR